MERAACLGWEERTGGLERAHVLPFQSATAAGKGDAPLLEHADASVPRADAWDDWDVEFTGGESRLPASTHVWPADEKPREAIRKCITRLIHARENGRRDVRWRAGQASGFVQRGE